MSGSSSSTSRRFTTFLPNLTATMCQLNGRAVHCECYFSLSTGQGRFLMVLRQVSPRLSPLFDACSASTTHHRGAEALVEAPGGPRKDPVLVANGQGRCRLPRLGEQLGERAFRRGIVR